MDHPQPLLPAHTHYLNHCTLNRNEDPQYPLWPLLQTHESTNPRPRSTLEQLAYRVFPSMFVLLALTMLGTILTFALSPHKPMPRKIGIGIGGTFAIVSVLLGGSNWLIYARGKYARCDEDVDGSSRSGSPDIWEKTYNINKSAVNSLNIINRNYIRRNDPRNLGTGHQQVVSPSSAARQISQSQRNKHLGERDFPTMHSAEDSNVSLGDRLSAHHPPPSSVHGSPRVSGEGYQPRSCIMSHLSNEAGSIVYGQSENSQPQFTATPRVRTKPQRPPLRRPNSHESRSAAKSPHTTNPSRGRSGFEEPRSELNYGVPHNPHALDHILDVGHSGVHGGRLSAQALASRAIGEPRRFSHQGQSPSSLSRVQRRLMTRPRAPSQWKQAARVREEEDADLRETNGEDELEGSLAVRNQQESNIAHLGEQEVDAKAAEFPRMETAGSQDNESSATQPVSRASLLLLQYCRRSLDFGPPVEGLREALQGI